MPEIYRYGLQPAVPGAGPPAAGADPGHTSGWLLEDPAEWANGNVLLRGAFGSANANWAGCSVYISPNGTDYARLFVCRYHTIIGTLLTPLPIGATDYQSGATVDVDVSISPGVLVSTDLTGLFAGVNCALIDDEIASWQTATLIGVNQYRLTGFLRAAHDTEQANHVAGERFAVLAISQEIRAVPDEKIGETWYWKPVSFNHAGREEDISAVAAQTITLTGRGLHIEFQKGRTKQYIAGEALADAQHVYLSRADERVYLAVSASEPRLGLVQSPGLPVVAGEKVYVQHDGLMTAEIEPTPTGADWSWTPGAYLYGCAVPGDLSETPDGYPPVALCLDVPYTILIFAPRPGTGAGGALVQRTSLTSHGAPYEHNVAVWGQVGRLFGELAGTWDAIGFPAAEGVRFDPSLVPSGARICFIACAKTNTCVSIDVRLYDATAGAAIAGSDLNFDAVQLAEKQSIDLSAILPAGESRFIVQCKINGGGEGVVLYAAIEVRGIVGAGGGGATLHELASVVGLGPQHWVAGLAAGQALMATGPNSARFQAIPTSALPAHNLLSVYHGDTAANAPLAGALIYGNGTPAWDRLAHPGAAGYMLHATGAGTLAWTTAPRIADAGSFGFLTNGNISRVGANLLSVNNQLCFQGDATAYFYSYAAGAVGTTGNLYVSGVVGIGVAPGAAYQLYVTCANAADASAFGVFINVVNSNAAALTFPTYGQVVVNRRSSAFSVTGDMFGSFSRVLLSGNNATISNAYINLSEVQTGAGVARVFTNAYLYYARTNIAAGGSIDTLYGFYMPACTGTTRWGVYIADTGAGNVFAGWLNVGSGTAATAAGHIGCSRLYLNPTAYADGGAAGVWGIFGHVAMGATSRLYWDGITGAGDTYTYELSANYLVDVVGGTATLGRITGHIGIPATGRLYLDGVACAGDTYLYEGAANLIYGVAGGTNSFRLSATQWWTNVGTNTFTDATYTTKMQDMARCSAIRYVDMTTHTHTGDLLETTLVSYTVPANLLGTVKGLRISLVWRASLTPAYWTLRYKFGGGTIHTRIEGFAAAIYIWDDWIIFNTATNAQRSCVQSSSYLATPFVDYQVAAVDTTANRNIEVSIQLGDAGDSFETVMFVVELLQ
ncbi:MAG TPA: hypothetical protein VNA25_30445 [Phycisphaerae bacterium]|nr:hypothetical protein [Phycisphaerae bacterium]